MTGYRAHVTVGRPCDEASATSATRVGPAPRRPRLRRPSGGRTPARPARRSFRGPVRRAAAARARSQREGVRQHPAVLAPCPGAGGLARRCQQARPPVPLPARGGVRHRLPPAAKVEASARPQHRALVAERGREATPRRACQRQIVGSPLPVAARIAIVPARPPSAAHSAHARHDAVGSCGRRPRLRAARGRPAGAGPQCLVS